jgi:hypothetical protein
LFVDRADRICLFIFNSGGLWKCWFFVLDSDLKAKLKLSLSRSMELLVDGRIIGVEDNEGGGTVGVSLENSLGCRRDSK